MDGPEFSPTNEQRLTLGLAPVEPGWEWVRLKDSNTPGFESWACFDGDVIRKHIHISPHGFTEDEYQERTAQGRTLLLPRTERGKPTKLSATTLGTRKSTGMRLTWSGGGVRLWNLNTYQTYYSSAMDKTPPVSSLEDLGAWLERWREETTPEDLAGVTAFARAKRRHVKYREGDFFRFKVGRREYGYGRILLDYHKMRKEKEPFWDILMCRPLVVKVYHLITENPDVPPERLRELPAMPSDIVMDDEIYYGSAPIIGHLPLEDRELDFPILYGGSISGPDWGKKTALFQCGRIFKRLEGTEPLPGCMSRWRNNGVAAEIFVRRGVWEACIAAGNNSPAWEAEEDLRSPACREFLRTICDQFGLNIEQLPIVRK